MIQCGVVLKQCTVALIVLVTCAIAAPASAHTTGVSLEKDLGTYRVDIGYKPAPLVSGDRAVFDFNLKQLPNLDSVSFDYVWVRVEYNKQTLLATGVARADIGPTSLLIALPNTIKDAIVLNVRYQKGENALAETEFTVPITPQNTVPWGPIFALIMGICIGATAALGIRFVYPRRAE